VVGPEDEVEGVEEEESGPGHASSYTGSGAKRRVGEKKPRRCGEKDTL
jgi:hypothetical protein